MANAFDHVRGFLNVKPTDEFFPMQQLPHLKGVQIAWDVWPDKTTRRVKVFYENIRAEMVFTWTLHPATDRLKERREEYCDPSGKSYPTLQAAIRGGRVTLVEEGTAACHSL